MNTFIFDGSWNQIKGVLRQEFAQLTDTDLEFIQGKGEGEELLGRLQTRLGLNRAELEIMLEDIKASLSGGVQNAGEKIGRIKSKVSEIAGQWKAGTVADDLAAKATATAAGAEAKADEIVAEGRRKMRHFYECGEEQVRRKPREAVLIAIVAGFVIGLLIHRT